MKRMSAYSFSLLIALGSILSAYGQDTVDVRLKARFGADISAIARYGIDNKVIDWEGYAALDLNEKASVIASAGFLDFSYSQYNYDFNSRGFFMKGGASLNILNLKKSKGRYFGGLAVKYGISRYTFEIPSFHAENYWGRAEGSVASSSAWGHWIEFSPGMRAELSENISVGWSVDVRLLLYTGSPRDLKPVRIPGYGNATQSFSTGFRYYIEFSIPWKNKRVIIMPEEPEPEETQEPPRR